MACAEELRYQHNRWYEGHDLEVLDSRRQLARYQAAWNTEHLTIKVLVILDIPKPFIHSFKQKAPAERRLSRVLRPL